MFDSKLFFGLGNMIVVVTTFFGVSFLLLYVVHWIFHQSDLSLDAVVKFFLAGIQIAMPTVFFLKALMESFTMTFVYLFYLVMNLI